MDKVKFLIEGVPEALNHLDADTKPLWGSMNAMEMLDHLRVGIKMSVENLDGEIATPEEKLASYRRFLMSDRPFGQNLNKPSYFDLHQGNSTGSIDDQKKKFIFDLAAMLIFFEENPEHTAVHESYGRLNVSEWLQLHYKHFQHHLKQFGLIPQADDQ